MRPLPPIERYLQEGDMARFQYYMQGELWYKTDSGFQFPIPADARQLFMRDERVKDVDTFIIRCYNNMELERALDQI